MSTGKSIFGRYMYPSSHAIGVDPRQIDAVYMYVIPDPGFGMCPSSPNSKDALRRYLVCAHFIPRRKLIYIAEHISDSMFDPEGTG